MKKTRPSRRSFLRASAVATFGFQFFRGHLFGAAAPSNKLNLAAIGVGAKGQGVANLKACAAENIVVTAINAKIVCFTRKTIGQNPQSRNKQIAHPPPPENFSRA